MNVDYTVFLEARLRHGAKNLARALLVSFGGSAGNAATAAARILGPGRVRLLGCVGDDPDGEALLRELMKDGIDVSAILRIRGAPTGRAFVLIDPDGSSTVISVPGANLALKAADVEARAKLVEDAAGIIITNPPKEAGMRLAELAGSRVPIFLDPGRGWLHGLEELALLSQRSRLFYLPNELELLEASGCRSLREALERVLATLERGVLVVKRGAKGALLLDIASGEAYEIPVLPLRDLGMRVVSTVGCGDVFTGAFAAFVCLGLDPIEAARRAAVAAGLKATRRTSREAPSLAEVLRALEIVERRGLMRPRRILIDSI